MKVTCSRRELGVNRIHANELGVAKLTTIAGRIEQFSKRNDLRFSVFTVNKADHAIIREHLINGFGIADIAA